MGYRNLQECVRDLERAGRLVRVTEQLCAKLEIPAIQRRIYAAGAPAVLFENVKDSRFPLLANLFGTLDRCEYIFRDAIPLMERIMTLAIDPADLLRRPRLYLQPTGLRSLLSARFAKPCFVSPRRAPVLRSRTTLSAMPPLVSWPRDGGAYLTLPQVYSEDPAAPGVLNSNLGMYRVQISGNEYEPNREAGLHYQLHRGLGIHHTAAIARGERLPIRIFLGGPPAMTVAAVMPLPEGTSELIFAGLLGRRRVRLTRLSAGTVMGSECSTDMGRTDVAALPVSAEADFCIEGSIGPTETKPEGPFGDHLGYYSERHSFPVMRVDRVWHRPDAIFPFTVVGRPPQEDTVFGTFIHRLTAPLITREIRGIRQVHAVDAAGVHPLLLAIGQERYIPFDAERRPRELLTQAHALLGSGQLSLTKYLVLVAAEDNPTLDVYDVPGVFRHLLERIDLRRDLHFVTGTTIDTLDYSGDGLNCGSKLILTAAGPQRRILAMEPTGEIFSTPLPSVRKLHVVMPGVLVAEMPPHDAHSTVAEVTALCDVLRHRLPMEGDISAADTARWMLIVLVDDAASTTATQNDFLWTTFTKSNPATDVTGVGAIYDGVECSGANGDGNGAQPARFHGHWGCHGPLVVDARRKSHHATELVEDPATIRRIHEIRSLAKWMR